MFLVILTVFLIFNLVLSIPPAGWIQYEKGCSWRPDGTKLLKGNVYNRPPYYDIKLNDLPTTFDWRNYNNMNLVTPVRSQLVPRPCGSCWAHAVTGSLSDRIKINQYKTYGKVSVDINLAPQFLLDCGMYGSPSNINAGSCYGGSAYNAFELIHQIGISDESCDPYIGASPSHFSEVDSCADMMCQTCDRFGNCGLIDPSIVIYVDEYGQIDYEHLPTNVTMVQSMMSEIYTRGPIVCTMYAHGDSFENYSGGILIDNTKYNGTTHDLVLLGWGVENGTEYWIGRNSFGTYWGEQGFFYAQRGVDIYNMEEYCWWGTLKNF